MSRCGATGREDTTRVVPISRRGFPSASRCRAGRPRRPGRGGFRTRAGWFRPRARGRRGSAGPVCPAPGGRRRKTRIHSSNLSLELAGIDEAVDPERPEEMTDPAADAPLGDLLAQREWGGERAPVGPAQYAGEDIDHGCQAVALVAPVLAVPAERLECPALDHAQRVIRAGAGGVDRPAVRDRLSLAHRDLDLSIGRGARRHVDHDRRFLLAGKCDRDRVGPEHPLGRPKRGDQLGRVGHGPADHLALQSLEGIVARDAEVVRIADADPPRADGRGLLHRDRVGHGADDEAQPVVAVDGRRAGQLTDDADPRPGIDPAQGQHVEVRVQPRHPVRLDAPQVARHQDVRGLPRVGLGDAEMPEHAARRTRRVARWGRTAAPPGSTWSTVPSIDRVKSAWGSAARRWSCRC